MSHRAYVSERLKCFQAFISKKDQFQIFAGCTTHTHKWNLLKLWVLMSSFHKVASLQRFGNGLSFPTQATSCTGQGASCRVSGSAKVEGRGFQSSPSKPTGNASTFTPDICTADTGCSLQKLNFGKHILQGGVLQFVKPPEQAGAERAKQRLKLVSVMLLQTVPCWIPPIAAWKPKSLIGNAITLLLTTYSCSDLWNSPVPLSSPCAPQEEMWQVTPDQPDGD